MISDESLTFRFSGDYNIVTLDYAWAGTGTRIIELHYPITLDHFWESLPKLN